MYTRKQYMLQQCTHEQYYGQFVTPGLLRLVANCIGLRMIESSEDKWFNGIKQYKWDALTTITPHYIPMKLWKTLACDLPENAPNYYWCLSDNMCILKEAARQIRESSKTNHLEKQ
jgi:hypothetical protein